MPSPHTVVGSRQKACIHSLNHRKDEFRHTQHRQDYVVFPPPAILHFSLSPVFSPIPQSIVLLLSYPTWSRVYSLLHAHTCLLGCINVPTNVPILAHQPNHQASPAPTLSSTPQSHPALQPLQPACNPTCQQPHVQPGPSLALPATVRHWPIMPAAPQKRWSPAPQLPAASSISANHECPHT